MSGFSSNPTWAGLINGYETSTIHETRSMAATSSSASYSFLSSPPTYNGICAEKYIEWKLAIDNIFSQCYICDRRKIKYATSVLIDSASIWWNSLCKFDKLRTWNDMKMLM